MLTAIVVIPALAILLVYGYVYFRRIEEARALTVLLNSCPHCKANLRMRGFKGFRPCPTHRYRVEVFRKLGDMI